MSLLGNRFAVGNNGGRPPIFSNPEDMLKLADEYISKSIEAGEKLTVTGLAIYLGFESRQSMYDYEDKPEFSYIIRRAKLFIENGYEANLHGNNSTGSIFALKNMGWFDRQEIDQTHHIDDLKSTASTLFRSDTTQGIPDS